MGNFNYKYQINSEVFDDGAFELESPWSNEHAEDAAAELIAEDAAEDYYGNHEGYEESWPCVISVFTESGRLLGTFTVEIELSPVFSATRKK